MRSRLRPRLRRPRYLDWLHRVYLTLDEYGRLHVGLRERSTELDLQQRASVMPIPLPPLEEQRAIADYLDRETARIDTLIEEQQRLIEMLRERRAATDLDAASRAGLVEDRDVRVDLGVLTDWAPSLRSFVADGRRTPVPSSIRRRSGRLSTSAAALTMTDDSSEQSGDVTERSCDRRRRPCSSAIGPALGRVPSSRRTCGRRSELSDTRLCARRTATATSRFLRLVLLGRQCAADQSTRSSDRQSTFGRLELGDFELPVRSAAR